MLFRLQGQVDIARENPPTNEKLLFKSAELILSVKLANMNVGESLMPI
jgi:hypothetical protein